MNDTTQEMNFIYKVFLSLFLTLSSRVIWLKIFMGRWFITLHTAWRHQIASILRCCCCCCCSFLLHHIKLFAIFLRRFFLSPVVFDVFLCRWHYKLSHMAQVISFINTNWVMKLFLLRCLLFEIWEKQRKIKKKNGSFIGK